MDTAKRFKVDKLIRDKLPEIMREKGIAVHERTLEKEEFLTRLKDKLIEEATEVQHATSTHDLKEELADLLEVIHTLAKNCALSVEEIEEARVRKREARGGFEKRVYNHFVALDESNPAIEYYRARSHQYPEIT